MTKTTTDATTNEPVTVPLRSPSYFIGCDLGQASDFTALVVLEARYVDTGRTETSIPGPVWYDRGRKIGGYVDVSRVYENHYAVRHLERLAKGTPYPKQVALLKGLFDNLEATTRKAPTLVVDATGVGRPVLDMIRAIGLYPTAVTITAGDKVSQEDYYTYRVPKRDLVSVAQILLQSDRLKIAKALPDAQTLVDELLAFKVNINARGHDSYGNDVGSWRENPHDDLVLATSLAAWFAER